MSFTVETGAGIADANSYVDVATADSYFADRQVSSLPNSYATVWSTMTNQDKQAALVIATSYIDAKYNDRYRGRRLSYTQGLSWPRIGATVDGDGSDSFIPGFGPLTYGFIIGTDEVPIWLKRAVIEMAARCYKADPDPDVKMQDGFVKMVKLGPLEKEYAPPFIPITLWRYVDKLLTPILKHSAFNLTIVRT